MRCIYCGCEESKVIDTRPVDNNAIRRRRECVRCGKRMTTYEKIEMRPLVVVKKDGRREALDMEKVRSGILKACEKRPIPLERIDAAVNAIEQELYNSADGEVYSDRIGELVMDQLMKLDEVAYVRFASVYRQFKDVQSFMEELSKLIGSGAKAEDTQQPQEKGTEES